MKMISLTLNTTLITNIRPMLSFLYNFKTLKSKDPLFHAKRCMRRLTLMTASRVSVPSTTVHSLKALENKKDYYGALLVCSILDKLAINFRRNIARAQGNKELALDALRKALQALQSKSEVDILEVFRLPFQQKGDDTSCSSKNVTLFQS